MICQINTCNEKNLLLEVFSFFKTRGTERVKKKINYYPIWKNSDWSKRGVLIISYE